MSRLAGTLRDDLIQHMQRTCGAHARRIAAESAKAVHQALARVAVLDPIRVPTFLIDDEHLLHGDASPAFFHDLLQTLAELRRTIASTPWVGLSKWTS